MSFDIDHDLLDAALELGPLIAKHSAERVSDQFATQIAAQGAGVLLGAVDKNPRDGDAWLALANALVGHADGMLSPASLYAFRNAMVVAPDHPGPPYFIGLAYVQAQQFDRAEEVWQSLLDRAPAEAPWRAQVAEKLDQLRMMRMQAGG